MTEEIEFLNSKIGLRYKQAIQHLLDSLGAEQDEAYQYWVEVATIAQLDRVAFMSPRKIIFPIIMQLHNITFRQLEAALNQSLATYCTSEAFRVVWPFSTYFHNAWPNISTFLSLLAETAQIHVKRG